jgi:hypothetical protein
MVLCGRDTGPAPEGRNWLALRGVPCRGSPVSALCPHGSSLLETHCTGCGGQPTLGPVTLKPDSIPLEDATWESGPTGWESDDLGTTDGRVGVVGKVRSYPPNEEKTEPSPPTPSSKPRPAVIAGVNALRGHLKLDEPAFRVALVAIVTAGLKNCPKPIVFLKGDYGAGKTSRGIMMVAAAIADGELENLTPDTIERLAMMVPDLTSRPVSM